MIKLIHLNAKIPTKNYSSAGFDLYSVEEVVIPKNDRCLIGTGVVISTFPVETYGRIAPRSGLAWKNGLNVGAGVIDPDYRGEIKVLIFNHSNVDYVVHINDRIAQLIFEKFHNLDNLVVVDQIEKSIRENNGFGSSGI